MQLSPMLAGTDKKQALPNWSGSVATEPGLLSGSSDATIGNADLAARQVETDAAGRTGHTVAAAGTHAILERSRAAAIASR